MTIPTMTSTYQAATPAHYRAQFDRNAAEAHNISRETSDTFMQAFAKRQAAFWARMSRDFNIQQEA